jgi:hypothetical protein
MSSIAPPDTSLSRPWHDDERREREALARWRRSRDHQGGPSWGFLLSTMAVAGLGLLAWYKFGSDLKRYLKISRM